MRASLLLRTCTICAGLLFGVLARAGLGPENTAVVVNGDSWASITVANEYAKLRGVPASNFVVLHGLSDVEQTNADRFRNEILGPVFEALDRKGIRSQIDCIVYSVDLPYAVYVDQDMAGKKFPQIITPVAAINGLTYLHDLVAAKDTDYLRLDVNRYTRRILPLPQGVALSPSDRTAYAAAMQLYDAKKYKEAIVELDKLVTQKKNDPSIAYNLACCLALSGRPDDAVAALRKAVSGGWRNFGMTSSDPDLSSLAGRTDFQELLRLLRSRRIEVQPGAPFRSRYAWNEAGEQAAAGPHYVLSTVLGVATGRGNSIAEIIACLDRACAADFTAPKGTIYFPKNGDVRSTTREWGFLPATVEIKRAGVNAVVEDGALPNGHDDVAGAMVGTADFNWSSSHSTMLPGAICEHLTSFGAVIAERAGQTPCTEFIRAGAAGSSGTVTEPFALQEKFPTPFMHVEYVNGFTLGESFYQSLYGPYQLLIIGDPMCRPWAKPMRVSLPAPLPGATVKGVLSLKPHASRNADVNRFELYVDGKFASEAPAGLTLNTTTLADGYHELAIVAVEKGPTEARTHAVIPVVVANHGKKASMGPAAIGAVFGDKVEVPLACAGASSIDLSLLSDPVGRIGGAKGTITVDTSKIGVGRALLRPVAHVGGATVFGAPIALAVAQSPGIDPSAPQTGSAMEPGLVLTLANGNRAIVKDTIDGGWLQKLVAGTNQSFVLTGYFEVPATGLYQLQMQTNTSATVEISGVKVATAADAKWRLAGFTLRPGTHSLIVHGVAPAGATLDIRLGCAGALHLAEGQFRHPKR